MARARTRARRRLWIALAVAVVAWAGLWILRAPVLTSMARVLVEEDAWAPADLVAVLSETPLSGVAVAAEAVRDGYVKRVLVLATDARSDAELLRRLQITVPPPDEVAILVLVRLGVPREAIVLEPLPGGGTNAAIRAVARYARDHGTRRVILVASRSHTRRAAILLRRALGPGTVVIARASSRDGFEPRGWWQHRDQAREVMAEGLRWLNSLVLGDLWS